MKVLSQSYGNLTDCARVGYDGNENLNLWSSPCWYAHKLGAYLHATGRNPPSGVRMGRGSIVHNGDTSYKLDIKSNTWERIK